MKLKKLGILVLAAAVLAVMTGGMASAQTQTYTGTDRSETAGGNADFISTISQTKYINNGDTLKWSNRWENNDPGAGYMSCICTWDNPYLSPRGGTYDSGSQKIDPFYNWYMNRDTETGSAYLPMKPFPCEINIRHGYKDNNGVTLWTGFTTSQIFDLA
jgi:hypothetical protein